MPWRHPTPTVIYTTASLVLDAAGLVPAEGRADASVVIRWTSDATLLSPAPRWPREVDGMDAAIEVLRNDDWPQQYAAMGLLRALGAEVEGVGYDDEFLWRLTRPGGRRARYVEPSVKDRTRRVESLASGREVGALDHARAAIANTMNRLGERERIILTLHYYEKLSIDDVASVLGVDVGTVRRLHQKALRAIRRSISEPMWELLGQLAREAPATPDPGGALALIRELTAV